MEKCLGLALRKGKAAGQAKPTETGTACGGGVDYPRGSGFPAAGAPPFPPAKLLLFFQLCKRLSKKVKISFAKLIQSPNISYTRTKEYSRSSRLFSKQQTKRPTYSTPSLNLLPQRSGSKPQTEWPTCSMLRTFPRSGTPRVPSSECHPRHSFTSRVRE